MHYYGLFCEDRKTLPQVSTWNKAAGEARRPTTSTSLSTPPAQTYWDIYLNLSTWYDYFGFLVATYPNTLECKINSFQSEYCKTLP